MEGAMFSEHLAVFFLLCINSVHSFCTMGYFSANSEAKPSVANRPELSRKGLDLCVRIKMSILAEWCKIWAYSDKEKAMNTCMCVHICPCASTHALIGHKPCCVEVSMSSLDFSCIAWREKLDTHFEM